VSAVSRERERCKGREERGERGREGGERQGKREGGKR
jgi:hypothetical protein